MPLIINLFVWSLFWIIVKLTYYKYQELFFNYIKHPLISLSFYLFAAVSAFVVFSHYLTPLLLRTTFWSTVALGLFFVLAYVIYFIGRKTFSSDQLAGHNHPNFYFAKLDTHYLLVKSFDILFQQLLIAVLILTLSEMNVPLTVIVFIFALTFGALHLPLIKIKSVKLGAFFTLASIMAAFFFPHLILYQDGGLIFSYIIHWSFYIMSGVLINMYEKRRIT